MHLLQGKNSQNGQILLVVVLAAVISLTVGLSAVSRTITNTRVSTEEANSQKALSAAEAGIEELINNNNAASETGLKPLSNQSQFNAAKVEVSGLEILLNNGQLVKQDEGADVWLSDYPNLITTLNTSLTVYWKNKPGGGCDLNASVKHPAIEVAVISGDRTGPAMKRYAVDGCTGRANNFSNPNPVLAGKIIEDQTFDHGFALTDPIVQGYIVRIIPLYADAVLGVVSTTSLPSQGFNINSTGQAGNAKRKVSVYQGFPRLPVEFFPYNLFLP